MGHGWRESVVRRYGRLRHNGHALTRGKLMTLIGRAYLRRLRSIALWAGAAITTVMSGQTVPKRSNWGLASVLPTNPAETLWQHGDSLSGRLGCTGRIPGSRGCSPTRRHESEPKSAAHQPHRRGLDRSRGPGASSARVIVPVDSAPPPLAGTAARAPFPARRTCPAPPPAAPRRP